MARELPPGRQDGQLRTPSLITMLQTSSRVAGGTSFIVGIAVLAGWMFDVPMLKSIFPGWAMQDKVG
jgi:hypothetical protein